MLLMKSSIWFIQETEAYYAIRRKGEAIVTGFLNSKYTNDTSMTFACPLCLLFGYNTLHPLSVTGDLHFSGYIFDTVFKNTIQGAGFLLGLTRIDAVAIEQGRLHSQRAGWCRMSLSFRNQCMTCIRGAFSARGTSKLHQPNTQRFYIVVIYISRLLLKNACIFYIKFAGNILKDIFGGPYSVSDDYAESIQNFH